MTNFFTKFLTFLLLFNESYGYFDQYCYCTYTPDVVLFCTSCWISHVKIMNKTIVQANSNSHEPFSYTNSVKYEIEHIHVLKDTISDNNSTLPNFVLTPQSFHECGLSWLEEGEEYILTGRASHTGTLLVSLCDGLNFNDNKNETIAKINLWKKIIPCSDNSNDTLHSHQHKYFLEK
uniref:NTR domain-containing protein n=1 Tax=Strongyloides papillosus TaxID=174720 RepID=A0A0N5C5D4_STREA